MLLVGPMWPSLRCVLLAACFSSNAANTESDRKDRWREVLLKEARQRIQSWYTDADLMEAPQIRSGIKVSMKKQDMPCGGDTVPVTFAEFDVVGARPVDIFHTMLDTPKQKEWNPQCSSVRHLGDYPQRGVRAWAVTFNIPFVSNREFLQWQAADANFSKEEFWLVFSTQKNEELEKISPVPAGSVESQNCLGAYHITRSDAGAHVVVTQHVNVHPFFMFPLHQVLSFFPPAWQGTIDFVNQMGQHSKKLASRNSTANSSAEPANSSAEPAFMLEASPEQLEALSTSGIINRDEVFPTIVSTATAQNHDHSLLQCAVLVFLHPVFILAIATISLGVCQCGPLGVQPIPQSDSPPLFIDVEGDIETQQSSHRTDLLSESSEC